jgi:hypothetical protein
VLFLLTILFHVVCKETVKLTALSTFLVGWCVSAANLIVSCSFNFKGKKKNLAQLGKSCTNSLSFIWGTLVVIVFWGAKHCARTSKAEIKKNE